jgi:hypothetical protein
VRAEIKRVSALMGKKEGMIQEREDAIHDR